MGGPFAAADRINASSQHQKTRRPHRVPAQATGLITEANATGPFGIRVLKRSAVLANKCGVRMYCGVTAGHLAAERLATTSRSDGCLPRRRLLPNRPRTYPHKPNSPVQPAHSRNGSWHDLQDP